MKQLILLIGAIVISSACFADASSLNGLSSAFKLQPSAHPKQNQNDITMVYGGADISRKPTLVSHTATA